jgi:alpha-beta hydrolase superfamily lysophospholipase
MEKLEANDKKFKSWDGLYHELHNEPEQEQVIQFYIDWVRSHAK